MQIGSKHLVRPADWYSWRYAAPHFPPRFIVQNSARIFILIITHGELKGDERHEECGMGECSHDNDVIAAVVAYCWVWVDGERDFIAPSVLFRFSVSTWRDVAGSDIIGLVTLYLHDIFLICVRIYIHGQITNNVLCQYKEYGPIIIAKTSVRWCKRNRENQDVETDRKSDRMKHLARY